MWKNPCYCVRFDLKKVVIENKRYFVNILEFETTYFWLNFEIYNLNKKYLEYSSDIPPKVKIHLLNKTSRSPGDFCLQNCHAHEEETYRLALHLSPGEAKKVSNNYNETQINLIYAAKWHN